MSKRVSKKTAKKTADAITELSQAKDEQAREQLKVVSECYQAWHAAEERRKETGKALKERVDGARAKVRAAVEKPLKASATKADVQGKVVSIEMAWQDLDEERAHAAEERKAAAEEVKAAKVQLDRAIRESRQLAFPFAAAEAPDASRWQQSDDWQAEHAGDAPEAPAEAADEPATEPSTEADDDGFTE